MSEPGHVTQARAERAREKEAARLEQFEDALQTAAATSLEASAALLKLAGFTLTEEDRRGFLYGLQELLAETYGPYRPDPEKAFDDAALDYSDAD